MSFNIAYMNNNDHKYHYEIHITVQCNNYDLFKHECAKHGIKTIFIQYNTSDTNKQIDAMTSVVFYGTDIECKQYVISMLNILKKYKILRTKIETFTKYYSVPQQIDQKFQQPNQYFESHFEVLVDKQLISKVEQLCNKYNLYLSHNINKQSHNGHNRQMCLLRGYDQSYPQFKSKCMIIGNLLAKCGMLEKLEVEFVLYDSNISHDNEWFTAPKVA